MALEFSKQWPKVQTAMVANIKAQMTFLRLRPGDAAGAQKMAEKLSKAHKKNARKKAKAKKASATAAAAATAEDETGEGDEDDDAAAADNADSSKGDSKSQTNGEYRGPRTVEELQRMDPHDVTEEMVRHVFEADQPDKNLYASPEMGEVIAMQVCVWCVFGASQVALAFHVAPRWLVTANSAGEVACGAN